MSDNGNQIAAAGGPATSEQKPLKQPDFLELIGLRLPDEFKAELLQLEQEDAKPEPSGYLQTAARNRPDWKYYDNWKAAEFDCPACKWHRLGSALEDGDIFEECFEYVCPSCGEIILVFAYPTVEEARANWDKLSASERKDLEESERRYNEFHRRKLRGPSQLPEINAPSFALTWDFEGNDSHRNTLIKHDKTVIFAEPAVYEGYRRFIEVAEILRRHYGAAIRDLVPTDRSKLYLYGDRLSAPEIVADARKRIFSAPAGDAEPKH